MVKVGYISPVDPNVDRMTWSGTFYNTFHAIKNAGIDIEWIPSNHPQFLYKVITKSVATMYRINYGNGSPAHSTTMTKAHQLFLNKQKLNKYDLLFVAGQGEVVAGLDDNIPIIYYSDATFKIMINYYWFDFSKKAIKEGNKIEKTAIKNAAYNFRASHWAAKSTVEDYDGDSNNTYVFPFGADVPDKHKNASLPNYKDNELKLLFSGKEWDRKGGDIAVEAADYLNKIGIKCTLYIAGIRNLPEKLKNKHFIKFIGYMDKNNSQDYQQYLNLYHKCNAFILPTRAECAGLVFSEANAFGMPIFSTDTGGIADYVINEKNGYRLPLDANGIDFGKCIAKVYKERKFEDFSLQAKEIYNTSTSWKAWSEKFKQFIDDNF